MKRIAILLGIIPMACVGGSAAVGGGGSKAAPELIVDIDVNDEVWMRDRPMTEDDIAVLVAQLKRNGCQTLLVRCGCLGLLPYRTELSYPMSFDVDHARANPVPGMIPNMEAYIAQRTAWDKRYAEVIRAFNPPEVFFREAHKQNMKVLAWIDLFDDLWPGYRSKFLEENPHCQWVGGDGTTYFNGLTDYSWPEARAFRVAQARELLDWGANGIHCSTSAHCRHLPIDVCTANEPRPGHRPEGLVDGRPKNGPNTLTGRFIIQANINNTHQKDFFGYSRPIVDAFQAKYGVDIRTAEDFDKAAWHDLKGEAMVQLYRDLADLCHSRNKELWVGLQLGRYTQFAVNPHFSTNVVARYSNHWKRLVDERIAEAFILGDYEIASNPNDGYWRAKQDIQRRDGENLFAWAAREYQPYCKGKTRLYLFSEWLPDNPQELDERLQFWVDITCTNGFEGIDVHEAANFEKDPSSMAELDKMADRLRACGVAEPSCPLPEPQ